MTTMTGAGTRRRGPDGMTMIPTDGGHATTMMTIAVHRGAKAAGLEIQRDTLRPRAVGGTKDKVPVRSRATRTTMTGGDREGVATAATEGVVAVVGSVTQKVTQKQRGAVGKIPIIVQAGGLAIRKDTRRRRAAVGTILITAQAGGLAIRKDTRRRRAAVGTILITAQAGGLATPKVTPKRPGEDGVRNREGEAAATKKIATNGLVPVEDGRD